MTKYVMVMIVLLANTTILCANFFDYDRAISAAQRGDVDTAQACMQRMVVDSPECPDILYDTGVLAAQKQEHDKAAAYFDRVTQLPAASNRLKEYAHFNHANMLVSLKKLEEAIKQYEKALEYNPENNHARHNLTTVKEMLKQQQEQQQKSDQQDQEQQNKDQEDQQEKQQNDNQQKQDNNNQENSDAKNQSGSERDQKNGKESPSDSSDCNNGQQQKSEEEQQSNQQQSKRKEDKSKGDNGAQSPQQKESRGDKKEQGQQQSKAEQQQKKPASEPGDQQKKLGGAQQQQKDQDWLEAALAQAEQQDAQEGKQVLQAILNKSALNQGEHNGW